MEIIYAILIFTFVLTVSYWIVKHFSSKKKDVFKEVQTSDLKRVSPDRAKYTYKFGNGIRAWQSELTLESDKKLAELFAELNLTSFDAKLLETLVKNNLLENFFKIILNVDYQPAGSNFSQLFNSEIEVVIADFFTLNPLAKKGLELLNGAAVLTGLPAKNSKEPETMNEKGTVN